MIATSTPYSFIIIPYSNNCMCVNIYANFENLTSEQMYVLLIYAYMITCFNAVLIIYSPNRNLCAQELPRIICINKTHAYNCCFTVYIFMLCNFYLS